MTFCHGPLHHTTYMLSYQSKSNELREARDVFFQWLSGHSQTGKCLVDRYRLGISIGIGYRERISIKISYGISIAFAIHSVDHSLEGSTMGLLSHSLFIRLILRYPLS